MAPVQRRPLGPVVAGRRFLYRQQALPADLASSVQKAGGTLVYAYPQIGVAVASSTSDTFRANLLEDSRIQNASSTAGFAVQLRDNTSAATDAGPAAPLPSTPATDSDSLSPLQWDMQQINAPAAHAIAGGSPSVLVGDIDTGVDFNHPDLKANLDVAAPGVGRLRLRLGGHPRRRRDQQQLLRRSILLQLPERPDATRDLAGGAAGDPVRRAEGRHGRRRHRQRQRGPRASGRGRREPGRRDAGASRREQPVRGDPRRDTRRDSASGSRT